MKKSVEAKNNEIWRKQGATNAAQRLNPQWLWRLCEIDKWLKLQSDAQRLRDMDTTIL